MTILNIYNNIVVGKLDNHHQRVTIFQKHWNSSKKCKLLRLKNKNYINHPCTLLIEFKSYSNVYATMLMSNFLPNSRKLRMF